mmetsp:Transcript_5996/g.12430  ORF Transcript_5996/g.12430 Transcript_5996/m.12430 type:complete len:127 (-) Transcript_5996:173-553(-)
MLADEQSNATTSSARAAAAASFHSVPVPPSGRPLGAAPALGHYRLVGNSRAQRASTRRLTKAIKKTTTRAKFTSSKSFCWMSSPSTHDPCYYGNKAASPARALPDVSLEMAIYILAELRLSRKCNW